MQFFRNILFVTMIPMNFDKMILGEELILMLNNTEKKKSDKAVIIRKRDSFATNH